MGRIAGRFARYEPRLRAGRLVMVLLSDLPRRKGTRTVGVQRQYTGAAGRVESSHVAVCLVYAGERRLALYVPRSWTCDPDRCRAAGLGEDTVFATKPDLARTMIERFLDARPQADRVTGDEVYGGNPKLRAALEERGTVMSSRHPARP